MGLVCSSPVPIGLGKVGNRGQLHIPIRGREGYSDALEGGALAQRKAGGAVVEFYLFIFDRWLQRAFDR